MLFSIGTIYINRASSDSWDRKDDSLGVVFISVLELAILGASGNAELGFWILFQIFNENNTGTAFWLQIGCCSFLVTDCH